MGATEENAGSFGSRLKEQRELREISLEEISKVTKISIHLLHAMESDEWERLPGGIFTRNFIRLYASYLGLEAERWVDDFKQYMKANKHAEHEDEHDEDAVEKRQQREFSTGWFYALLVVAIILLTGGYVVISYLRTPNEPVPRDIPVEPAQQQSAAAEQNQEARTLHKALRLELMETDLERRCWFQWWADGTLQTENEGISAVANSRVVLEADNKIRLHINHLDSVAVWLNGVRKSWGDFPKQTITDEQGVAISYVVDIALDTPN